MVAIGSLFPRRRDDDHDARHRRRLLLLRGRGHLDVENKGHRRGKTEKKYYNYKGFKRQFISVSMTNV